MQEIRSGLQVQIGEKRSHSRQQKKNSNCDDHTKERRSKIPHLNLHFYMRFMRARTLYTQRSIQTAWSWCNRRPSQTIQMGMKTCRPLTSQALQCVEAQKSHGEITLARGERTYICRVTKHLGKSDNSGLKIWVIILDLLMETLDQKQEKQLRNFKQMLV